MIVEQRIGRVQRLASDYPSVSIYNVTLRGTFEDYIVGRLMAKLQMAAHAIGDVEALLQGADVGDDDDDVGEGFEEEILKLVLATLAGKDVERAARLAEKSIEAAKAELEREEANINQMLGSTDGTEYVGPRSPTLPKVRRSMGPKDFTLHSLNLLGARVTPEADDLYLSEENGGRERIRFKEPAPSEIRSTFYGPGSPAFQRLVGRVVATGIHDIEDVDREPAKASEHATRKWLEGFGAKPTSIEIKNVSRIFSGRALLRVRATVAHDSYERLVDVDCLPDDHRSSTGRSGLDVLPRTIERPAALGIDVDKLKSTARLDDGISNFRAFISNGENMRLGALETNESSRN